MLARNKRPLYKRWQQFYYSTTLPGSHNWKTYGALGIRFYRSWCVPKVGFDRFEDWVYSNLGHPTSKHSVLSVINRNKNIGPGNLKWETPEFNYNNRRNSMKITIGGRRQTLAQWCRQLGRNKHTVWSRLEKGMTVREAFKL